MNDQVKLTILRALAAMGEQPMHESVVVSTCRVLCVPRPTADDVRAALEQLEGLGLVSGKTVELIGRYWGLTPAGQIKATQVS